MTRPVAEELASKIVAFIQEKANGIAPVKAGDFDSDWRKSGVYSVLDCVFSSMANFKSVVVPTLQRFSDNSGLTDEPSLTFSKYLEFVRDGEGQRPSPERFEYVARNIFGCRMKISGRLKVEVAYDVCEFFSDKGLETKQNLKDLAPGTPFTCTHPGKPGELECLVMDHIANVKGIPERKKVKGMGLALGSYLLMCLGDTSYVKPDTLLLRLVGRMGDWQPRASNEDDFRLIRQAVTCAADKLGTIPAHIDNVLWKYESDRSKAGGLASVTTATAIASP